MTTGNRMHGHSGRTAAGAMRWLCLVLLLVLAGSIAACEARPTATPTAASTSDPASSSAGASIFDNNQLGYWFDLEYTWPSSKRAEVLVIDSTDPWQVKITSTVYPEVSLWIRTTDRLGELYTAEELASYWAYDESAQKTKSMIGSKGNGFAVPDYEVLLEWNGMYKEFWVATADFSYLLTLYVGGLTTAQVETAADQLSESESDLVDCLSEMKLHFILYRLTDH